MKQLYILIILSFQTSFSFACLNTYQFKIFPVGVSQNKIVTVDVKIMRTSQAEGNYRLDLGLEKNEEWIEDDKDWEEMWILSSYVSTYDKNQKLTSLIPIDITYSIGKTYADTLHRTFQRGLKKIATEYADIEYFKPAYISFCDFQQKCNIVKIQSDTVSRKSYLVYDGKKYQTDIINDTSYYGFRESLYHPELITALYVNSIRVFKTKTITLLIVHLVRGHEVSMGFITSDPERFRMYEDSGVRMAKEYKPNFKFTDIRKSTYEEPVLHHGYGFDIFVII